MRCANREIHPIGLDGEWLVIGKPHFTHSPANEIHIPSEPDQEKDELSDATGYGSVGFDNVGDLKD
jgi:hypothetical protein